jgi:hypothetical protein
VPDGLEIPHWSWGGLADGTAIHDS